MRWRALFVLVSIVLAGATWRAISGDDWLTHYLDDRAVSR